MSTESMNAVSQGRLSDQQIAEQLVEQAKMDGVDLVGPGGLLSDLTKTVLETALEVEMSEHLGYDKHAIEGRNNGNSRNGTRTKTVLTQGRPGDDRGAPGSGGHVRAEDGQEALPEDARCR